MSHCVDVVKRLDRRILALDEGFQNDIDRLTMVSHGRADLNFVIVDPVLMSGSIGTDAVAKAFCKDFLLLNVNELVF